MATKLQPVKISLDIFNNTAPERGAGPQSSRVENFGRRNCSKPLASIELSPPPLKGGSPISPINHQQMHSYSPFRRSGSYEAPSDQELNYTKTTFQKREPGHVKPKQYNAWDMLAL